MNTDLLIEDLLPYNVSNPTYTIDEDTTILYCIPSGISDVTVVEQPWSKGSGFTFPMIDLDSSYEEYKNNGNVNQRIRLAIEELVITAKSYAFQKLSARDYEHAYDQTVDTMGEISNVALCGFGAENEYIKSHAHLGELFKKAVIVPGLGYDELIFYPPPQKFGVLAIRRDNMAFSAGILFPHRSSYFTVKHPCGASNVKCECGAVVANTTHAKWCPKY